MATCGAYGESIHVNGTVDGDLYMAGDRVRIGQARISGELRYRGTHDVEIDPGAEVAGGIQHQRRSAGTGLNALATGATLAASRCWPVRCCAGSC